MDGSERPMPGSQEMDVPEVDPYFPEGAFGQWVKDVMPDSPEYEALSDRALREELEGEMDNPDLSPDDRDVTVSALGTLKVQEYNNRRLPGYGSASASLDDVIKTTLLDHHQRKVASDGASPDHMKYFTHVAISDGLRGAMDNIVATKATSPQLPSTQ